jgi:hypothetical protein
MAALTRSLGGVVVGVTRCAIALHDLLPAVRMAGSAFDPRVSVVGKP